jgi:hypothetical protein
MACLACWGGGTQEGASLSGDEPFCDLVRFKKVGKDGFLVQLTFFRGESQLPYSGLVEAEFVANYISNARDYLYVKVRPDSPEYRERLNRSRQHK